ncbi:universal stress protein [Micromonospora sp. WMMD812]|uniref:universal stress protein n=1 Tax=Micromonospora sp. WMMD812 TaxID=3015152 RepID=UPI00248BE348|nr:universal stress protein [Micromonospora sp. WMMD812]WBB69611.1 universal stress protein [Micromonospora sp. WMMD812]
MTIESGAPVVVGVDGSAAALDAVRVATREAAYRRRSLRVVHAFHWPLAVAPLGLVPAVPADDSLRREAERVAAEAAAEAGKIDPEVPVTAVVIDGAPTPVLLDEARDAALVVLGHRGLGGFAGLLIGSVTVQVSARAECPVLVVRGEPRADGPVVVGVDGSALSTEAVAFAFEEAARRDAPLVAVHAWLDPAPVAPGDLIPMMYDLTALGEDEERVLAESVAGWAERYPEVSVRHRLVRGAAAPVLVAESASAQLVVVGAHGRGALGGLLLGSVSHALLHHAHAPLAIVRHRRTADAA